MIPFVRHIHWIIAVAAPLTAIIILVYMPTSARSTAFGIAALCSTMPLLLSAPRFRNFLPHEHTVRVLRTALPIASLIAMLIIASWSHLKDTAYQDIVGEGIYWIVIFVVNTLGLGALLCLSSMSYATLIRAYGKSQIAQFYRGLIWLVTVCLIFYFFHSGLPRTLGGHEVNGIWPSIGAFLAALGVGYSASLFWSRELDPGSSRRFPLHVLSQFAAWNFFAFVGLSLFEDNLLLDDYSRIHVFPLTLLRILAFLPLLIVVAYRFLRAPSSNTEPLTGRANVREKHDKKLIIVKAHESINETADSTLRDLYQQISLKVADQLESRIDSWKSAREFLSVLMSILGRLLAPVILVSLLCSALPVRMNNEGKLSLFLKSFMGNVRKFLGDYEIGVWAACLLALSSITWYFLRSLPVQITLLRNAPLVKALQLAREGFEAPSALKILIAKFAWKDMGSVVRHRSSTLIRLKLLIEALREAEYTLHLDLVVECEPSSVANYFESLQAEFAQNFLLTKEKVLQASRREQRRRVPQEQNYVDFGILTIREDENKAVLDRFPEIVRTVDGHRRYRLRRLPLSTSKAYTVAVVQCAERGNGEAQAAARDMIEDLAPSWLVVVGIAGGVPANEFSLGDVVVSSRIVDFTVEAVLNSAREYALAGGPLHPNAAKLVADIAAITHDREIDGWNSEQSIGRSLPPVEIDDEHFDGPEEWTADLRKKIIHRFKTANPRLPIATTGAIASSDRLIKDTEVLKVWLKFARQVQAVEMESAGVYRAAHAKSIPFLAIRGISDVVGFKRDAAWTDYACHSAAAFTRAFLRVCPIPPR